MFILTRRKEWRWRWYHFAHGISVAFFALNLTLNVALQIQCHLKLLLMLSVCCVTYGVNGIAYFGLRRLVVVLRSIFVSFWSWATFWSRTYWLFQLVYWDDRSVFLEHTVITLRDGKRRCFLLSRQHALSNTGHSTDALLKDLAGSEITPTCPEYIQEWLKSMEISSSKLRKVWTLKYSDAFRACTKRNALMFFRQENVGIV